MMNFNPFVFTEGGMRVAHNTGRLLTKLVNKETNSRRQMSVLNLYFVLTVSLFLRSIAGRL